MWPFKKKTKPVAQEAKKSIVLPRQGYLQAKSSYAPSGVQYVPVAARNDSGDGLLLGVVAGMAIESALESHHSHSSSPSPSSDDSFSGGGGDFGGGGSSGSYDSSDSGSSGGDSGGGGSSE